MRVPLPNLRPNGHAPHPAQVFVISGMCQDPRFRLRFADSSREDFCFIYLGASQFGAPPPPGADLAESAGDPYFVLRRWFDGGEAVVALRVDWEGIFTLLANDETCAEAVFQEIIAPSAPESPEDIVRQWSGDEATGQMFADLLLLA